MPSRRIGRDYDDAHTLTGEQVRGDRVAAGLGPKYHVRSELRDHGRWKERSGSIVIVFWTLWEKWESEIIRLSSPKVCTFG